MKNRLISWWISTQPMFAFCLDCGKKGITTEKFATLMAGRIAGKWFTGAGTCIECYENRPILVEHTGSLEDFQSEMAELRNQS